jgi:hypothetical protein
MGVLFAAEKAARGGDEAAQAAVKAIDATEVFELTEAVVAEHDVIVFTAGSRDELLRWNVFCRNFTVVVGNVRGEDQVVPKPIKFIATAVAGASGYLFSDFGPGFMCSDHDGEPPVVRHVRMITNDKEVCQRCVPVVFFDLLRVLCCVVVNCAPMCFLLVAGRGAPSHGGGGWVFPSQHPRVDPRRLRDLLRG